MNTDEGYRRRTALHEQVRRDASISDAQVLSEVAAIGEAEYSQSASGWAAFWFDTIIPIGYHRPHLTVKLLHLPLRSLHAMGCDHVDGIISWIQDTYLGQSPPDPEREWLKNVAESPQVIEASLDQVEDELADEHGKWVLEELAPCSQVPPQRLTVSSDEPYDAESFTWQDEDPESSWVEATRDDESELWEEISLGVVFFVEEIDDWEKDNFQGLTQAVQQLDPQGTLEIHVVGLAHFPLFADASKPSQTLWVRDGEVVAHAPVGRVDFLVFRQNTEKLMATHGAGPA